MTEQTTEQAEQAEQAETLPILDMIRDVPMTKPQLKNTANYFEQEILETENVQFAYMKVDFLEKSLKALKTKLKPVVLQTIGKKGFMWHGGHMTASSIGTSYEYDHDEGYNELMGQLNELNEIRDALTEDIDSRIEGVELELESYKQQMERLGDAMYAHVSKETADQKTTGQAIVDTKLVDMSTGEIVNKVSPAIVKPKGMKLVVKLSSK